ncbi:MAG TPA: hypothetical protein VLN41_01980 [Candidatus Bathyarchaeia archaeon]|nr:hypothetical protein [Candidatus Bathyarchaeia archaeon]
MKIFKSILLVLLLCAPLAYPQTKDLGMGAFENERGPILLAVDAALADFQINAPYIMFVMYMASKDQNKDIVVSRNSIVMLYNGQEYKMPTIEELRKNYRGEIHDIDFYRHLGKEGIISTWARFYNFPQRADFFPALTLRSPVGVDEGSMYGFTGFRTKLYFKNPGFKKGDKVTFKVWDIKDPKIVSEVDAIID